MLACGAVLPSPDAVMCASILPQPMGYILPKPARVIPKKPDGGLIEKLAGYVLPKAAFILPEPESPICFPKPKGWTLTSSCYIITTDVEEKPMGYGLI